ncbi:uncharacterized protein RSE6_13342 [Rhynchosporium secalis]|uniref:Uncharacterized protein n=1 Tax=Rhynchosporium secalis TaxID=38038 RepID=A0A1E1MSP2_RHYSE|nr:uncharacterized protein RSE6_13342 [Rhynchosporium secalis]
MASHSFFKSLLFLCLAAVTLAGRRSYDEKAYRYHEPRGRNVSPMKHERSFDFLEAEPVVPRENNIKNLDGLSATDTFFYEGEHWTAYESLTSFDGPLVLVSASGKRREFPRHVEATAPESLNSTIEPLFGLNPESVYTAQNDVIAELLLKDGKGEPIEEHVRDITTMVFVQSWDTFLGNVQANDTFRINQQGETVNYGQLYDVPDGLDGTHSIKWWDSLFGWRPMSRKVFRSDNDPGDWIELLSFADVDSQDPKIIHVWFQTKYIKGGVMRQKNVALDYKEFLPLRRRPTVTQFYTALMRWADYWESKLSDVIPLTLPDQTWADMAKHSFAIELVQRPSGVSSQYGAYDRFYAGSEYDGFQDIFTTSLTANLAWGRFAQAKAVFENYMDWFVYDNGDIKMRGPEVGQFGMSLSLIARYVQYTGDTALVEKNKGKILAWAKLLTDLHDEGLKLPRTDPAYGLLSGWSESDAVLEGDSYIWVREYWNNGAMAARGFKDLSKISLFADHAKDWTTRAAQIINQTSVTINKWTEYNLKPPYVPIIADETIHAREALTADTNGTSPQRWAHRVYAELLQASVLSSNQTNTVINSMQAYGITSFGGLANVDTWNNSTRNIIGFIGYGYALSLLLQDRTDEFVLYLFTNRYRIYNRGSWIATEVAGTSIGGGGTTYCQPAQFGMPIVLRAALLFDHPDDEVLFVMKGVPRRWLSKGDVGIQNAPTKWGLVDFHTKMDVTAGRVTTDISFHRAPPAEVRVKFRVPQGKTLKAATIDGKAATIQGEEVIWKTSGAVARNVTIVGTF